MADVLSFVDFSWHNGETSRQIAINDRLLMDLLSSANISTDAQSTLLVEGIGFEHQWAYLESLRGGELHLKLAPGRVPIGYCEVCFDRYSDGYLLATHIAVGDDTIIWTHMGIDREELPSMHSGVQRTDSPASEEYGLLRIQPFSPEWSFEFNRFHYSQTIDAEIERAMNMANR